MLEFLYKVFIGHNHKWELLQSINRTDNEGTVNGIVKVLQCSICGTIKQVDID
jgi:hypothetical protein